MKKVMERIIGEGDKKNNEEGDGDDDKEDDGDFDERRR